MDALDSARRIIDRAMEHSHGAVDTCYLAHSGGKDSSALAHLLTTVIGSMHAIHCDDEITLPEHDEYLTRHGRIDRFIAPLSSTVHSRWHRPWADPPHWREPLSPALEWASREAESVEGFMASRGYRVAFLGRRRHESLRRAAILRGAGARMHRTADVLVCDPLRDWTDEDLWTYLRVHEIPICRAYRTLLMSCGASLHGARLGPLPLMPPEALWRGWPGIALRAARRYPEWRRRLVPARRPRWIENRHWVEVTDEVVEQDDIG